MAKEKQVVLVCTTAGLPYSVGDIFSVDESVAKALMNKDYKGDLRVRLYDEKKDSDALVAQRGKSKDVEAEAPADEK